MASTSISNAKLKRTAAQGVRVGYIHELRGMVTKWTQGVFAGSLGLEKHIEDIFLALMSHESSMVSAAIGRDTAVDEKGNPLIGSLAYKFLQSPKIKKLTGVEALNAATCTRAHGLSQSMGYNHVKGVFPGDATKGSICEIERLGAKILSPGDMNRILINPGDSITSIFGTISPLQIALHGTPSEETKKFIDNQILSGLLLLYGKYITTVLHEGRWYPHRGLRDSKSPINYEYKIDAALAGYLGVEGKDAQGSDAMSYVAAITEDHFKRVTGRISIMGSDGSIVASSAAGLGAIRGPNTTNRTPSGCSSG